MANYVRRAHVNICALTRAGICVSRSKTFGLRWQTTAAPASPATPNNPWPKRWNHKNNVPRLSDDQSTIVMPPTLQPNGPLVARWKLIGVTPRRLGRHDVVLLDPTAVAKYEANDKPKGKSTKQTPESKAKTTQPHKTEEAAETPEAPMVAPTQPESKQQTTSSSTPLQGIRIPTTKHLLAINNFGIQMLDLSNMLWGERIGQTNQQPDPARAFPASPEVHLLGKTLYIFGRKSLFSKQDVFAKVSLETLEQQELKARSPLTPMRSFVFPDTPDRIYVWGEIEYIPYDHPRPLQMIYYDTSKDQWEKRYRPARGFGPTDHNSPYYQRIGFDGASMVGAAGLVAVLPNSKRAIVLAPDPTREFFETYVFLDDNGGEWQKVQPKGTPPPLVASATLTPALGGRFVVLFGGMRYFESFTPMHTNEMYALDTETFEWSKPAMHGDLPTPRRLHSLTDISDDGSTLLLLGGRNELDGLRGMYQLKLQFKG